MHTRVCIYIYIYIYIHTCSYIYGVGMAKAPAHEEALKGRQGNGCDQGRNEPDHEHAR